MPTCCAPGCGNDIRNVKGKTYHRFPSGKPELLAQWMARFPRKNWNPSATSRLCSDHFEPNALDHSRQFVRLRDGAVPTIFTLKPRKTPTNKRSASASNSKSPEKPVLQPDQIATSVPVLQRSETTNVIVNNPNGIDDNSSSSCSKFDTNTIDNDHRYCKRTSRLRKICQSEHSYSVKDSPRFLKRKLNNVENKLELHVKRGKVMKQKIRRFKRKISSLKQVIDTLKGENMVSESGLDLLSATFSGVPLEIMSRICTATSRNKYSPELRKFALTLYFYSPKAYCYVRSSFKLCLPHPSVIRTWYKSMDGEPGWTSEAFEVLKLHAERAKSLNKKLICNLTIDEMAIRKHIEWDGKRFRGYVDIGTNADDDSLPEATEALVFMLVALDSYWKIPIGYFLINGLSGSEKANLVKNCLIKLMEIDVHVTSITCDGASSNQSMLATLGANTSAEKLQPYFIHPGNSSVKVYTILYVCHMLKLMRNTMATQIMYDKDGRAIKWSYIERLHQLQQNEGLRAGNKLRTAHIQWQKQKMKVNLAAQTISASVADALEFCQKNNLSGFEDCEGTIIFLRKIDHLFDILNSRNPLGKFSKAPMRINNKENWLPVLTECQEYIKQLKNSNGSLMTATNRKTPFLGFQMAIESVIGIFKDLVEPNESEPHLKYLLTYKLSQDHLELFFGCIRSHGGCNNNPTARQFVAIYKRLLAQHEIKASGGNCLPLDNVPILNCGISLTKKIVDDNTVVLQNMIKYNIIPGVSITDEEYRDVPDVECLSDFIENAVSYIAGFVVRNVEKHIDCVPCLVALRNHDKSDESPNLQLLQIKNRGGLVNPSLGVTSVCRATERCFRRMQISKPPSCKGFAETIVLSVTEDVMTQNETIFSELHHHMFDTEPLDNHRLNLVKLIAAEYTKIKLYHWGKQHTASITGTKLRKDLTKLIIFKHQ